jgi:2-polyprenyl-3-methyl-5-hydroxy-6-metoxy-1,4-benzoquinol methylase
VTTVLDVGCSVGMMGERLAQSGVAVTGIEFDPLLAAEARTRLREVIEADVEGFAAAGNDLGGRRFDCVVFADVLEHLRDPWTVARWGAGLVEPGGSVVISVPNVRHAETFWALARRRRWPYKEVGIFDRTHLRFFARANLPDLLAGTGFEIAELQRSYRLKLEMDSKWNRFAPYLGDLGTLQFIFRAERP